MEYKVSCVKVTLCCTGHPPQTSPPDFVNVTGLPPLFLIDTSHDSYGSLRALSHENINIKRTLCGFWPLAEMTDAAWKTVSTNIDSYVSTVTHRVTLWAALWTPCVSC